MSIWKKPPKAKVYEALSAVLDGRVELLPDSRAKVASSALDKSYSIRWIDGTNEITSTDSASRFQGYIGYPIIAVLLTTGRVPFDREIAHPLAGVPWKVVNDRFKRDYDAAVDFVLTDAGLSDEKRRLLAQMVDEIYDRLVGMDLRKPPNLR